MKRISLTYNHAVREQREEWAEFESTTRDLVSVEDSGLGMMTVLVDADSEAGVIIALAPLEREAARLGISELRVTGDGIAFIMEPVAP